ncbi:hypothetical protein HK101_001160 [Irineochytrium annulatum]|nr:hypothetical protein HK101_001160 [Irineochytrium annulatum]
MQLLAILLFATTVLSPLALAAPKANTDLLARADIKDTMNDVGVAGCKDFDFKKDARIAGCEDDFGDDSHGVDKGGKI